MIAEQGNASCFQVVLNKNMDRFDRRRWVLGRTPVLGERVSLRPPRAAEAAE